MCLVEHDGLVIGQDAHLLAPQGQIGEEQGMVDDQDLGVLHPPPGFVVETLGVVRTGAAHAVAVVARYLVPDGRQGAEIEVGQRAVGRPFCPVAEPTELVEFFRLVEQPGGAAQGVLQPPQAQVVSPPLDQHGRELQRDHAVQQRDVLADQLLLQADGVRGDDHAARGLSRLSLVGNVTAPLPLPLPLVPSPILIGGDGEDGGDEIGEALAHAGPRLDDQVASPPDGPIDGLGHGELFVAVFVVRQPGGNPSAGTKYFGV